MAFSDFLGQMGIEIGQNGSAFSFNFVGDIMIFLVAAVIVAVFTFWFISRKTYNKSLVMFREINGQTRRMGVEKAKEITLPGTSVRAYYLKKAKFYIPRPSIETGQDEFWYFIREDGEWVNVGLANLNKELKQLNLKYDHTDMRMANAALKRLVDKSYKKINWVKEWAPYIGFGVIIIMVAIGGYLVMGESAKVVSAAASNVQSLNEITTTMEEILRSLDNIVSSSGTRGV